MGTRYARDLPVRNVAFYIWAMFLALVTLLGTPGLGQESGLENYAVQPGYGLAVDSTGFVFPTSIAFVPTPGNEPDAPLYFVAELRGTIKVVTNDRQVHVFAQVPAARQQGADLFGDSQSGLAGMCLDPERGYVFATHTEADDGGVLRNRIVRFASKPGEFALQPSEVRSIDGMLTPFQSAPAHQIGNCVVQDGRLFVGVGDGGNPRAAADPETLLGKVLCLDLDGEPCPSNPLIQGRAESAVRPFQDFVYAYGFRNPFGLAWVQGDLYAAENGISADRFVRVRSGRDHLWRGIDQTLAAAADIMFLPTFSPVQLTYVPPDSEFMDAAWDDRFVTAAFGGFGASGQHTNSGLIGFGGLISWPPDLPRYLLEYVGPPGQHFAAIALGPDGIYTAPMVPGPDGTSPVLRVRHDPAQAHGTVVQARFGLESMGSLGPLAVHGCVSCHYIEGKGGGGIGPNLDGFGFIWRLTKRLNSAEYEAQVARVDAMEEEPFIHWREERHNVLAAEGTQRTWTWLKYFVQEPRFDSPDTQMPDLGLNEQEAEQVRAHLFQAIQVGGAGPLWQRGLRFAQGNAKLLLAGAVLGAGAALALGLGMFLLLRWRRART